MDLLDRILELYRYGYQCSQILAILISETIGEEHPELVRAMGGLNTGVGFSGGCCGCMTAGSCMLSLFTAKPDPLSYDSPYHREALVEFTKWFTELAEEQFDSVNCDDITEGMPSKRLEYCPHLIAQTYEKCMEILEEKGLLP